MSCCREVMEPVESSSCCTPKDTASDAARAMRTSGCGCSPVVEDLKTLKSEVPVADIMTPSSACSGAKEPVAQARRKLHEHRATSLPVVDEAGGCCGIVNSHRLEKR